MAEPKNMIPAVGLDGLAQTWEKEEEIRRSVLVTRRLLKWLSSEKTGVPTFPCAALNFEVLRLFFQKWVDVCPTKRTVGQAVCTREARFMLCFYTLLIASSGWGYRGYKNIPARLCASLVCFTRPLATSKWNSMDGAFGNS